MRRQVHHRACLFAFGGLACMPGERIRAVSWRGTNKFDNNNGGVVR